MTAAAAPAALVLDFAGVLFRWDPAALLARELPGARIDADAFFESYGGDWREFDCGRLDAGPLALRIALRTALDPDEALRVIDAVPHAFEADPAMVALVGELADAAAVPLYFLSNMPRPYAAVLEARHAFLARFAGGLYSGRTGLAKPDAALFARAAQVFGAEPARLLFVDDVAANVAAARAAGWRAERFTDAVQCRALLAANGLV